mgnify:CR=1 FL=1
MTDRNQDALRYHEEGRPGKIQVVPTKPTDNQRDLSLAYTPGVAIPCLAIAERLAQASGGRLERGSGPLGGARVVLVLGPG